MKRILFLIAFLTQGVLVFAQNAHFTTSGTIEYNKTSNTYAIIERQINKENESFYRDFFDAYKKASLQFRTLKSTLVFSNNKTLFTPIEPDNTGSAFINLPIVEQNNTVYNDFTTKSTVTQKKVFEASFLIKDTTRKIKWKITGETRDIAGYTCRRANGIMMDSIYVVAFYTEKIHVSGGPESFNGLPGMILEVAVPHENIIWVATKVTDMTIADNNIQQPKKGKVVTSTELKITLISLTKNWGNNAQFYLKGFLF